MSIGSCISLQIWKMMFKGSSAHPYYELGNSSIFTKLFYSKPAEVHNWTLKYVPIVGACVNKMELDTYKSLVFTIWGLLHAILILYNTKKIDYIEHWIYDNNVWVTCILRVHSLLT